MGGKRRRVLAIAVVAWVLIGTPWSARACGPEIARTVFTETARPDAPMEEFLRGRPRC